MTQAADQPMREDLRGDAPRCVPCVFGAWLFAQLAALAAGAAGVPLWARFPSAPHGLALHEMLAAQLLLSTLLFPWLMRGWAISAAVIATAWPMLILAGMVSENSGTGILAGGLSMSLWLLALAAWSHILRTQHSRLIALAVAVLICIGGVVLDYLLREFGPPMSSFRSVPIAGTLAQVGEPFSHWENWVIPPLLAALAFPLNRLFSSRFREKSASPGLGAPVHRTR